MVFIKFLEFTYTKYIKVYALCQYYKQLFLQGYLTLYIRALYKKV